MRIRLSPALIFTAFLTMLILALSSNALTIPTNIIAYTPIILTNTQGTAVSANTPISFTFNALNYQTYETNTLNNTELFYPNGTVAYSWLEGNVLNEQAKANTLYTSQNVLFWFKSPGYNSFLPANTGTATTNTIYLGFTGNIPSTSNILWGTQIGTNDVVGVAPQLTCAVPSSTTTCGKATGSGMPGVYGKWDNGNSMFSIYWNFTGISLPSGWTDSATGFTVNNELEFTASATSYVWYSTTTEGPDSGNILDSLGTYTTASQFINQFGFEAGSTGQNLVAWQTCSEICSPASSTNFLTATYKAGTDDYVVSSITIPSGSPEIFSVYWPSSSTANFIYNYGTTITQSTDIPASNLYIGGATAVGGSLSMNWVRKRINPPNGIMPSANVANSFAIAASSPSSNTIFQTATASVTDTGASGGSPSYTYQWLAASAGGSTFSASQANSICANAQSTTCSFATNSLTSTGTYQFELQATDSGNIIAISTTASISVAQKPTTIPTNIVAYTPIVFTNTQGTAVAANTPISFTFNALNYQTYETNTLNNTELFYPNGTLAYSWLEGNSANELTPANQLYLSNSVLFWFKSPGYTTWLGANTGTALTNTIYIGFVGNTPNTANLLWGTQIGTNDVVGVAPQLTCAVPSATTTCGKATGSGTPGVYGKWDNGNNIFSNYWNFTGSSLPSQFTTTDAAGKTVSNGISITAGSVYTSSTAFSSINNILEGLSAVTSSTATNSAGITQEDVINPNYPVTGTGILYITNYNTGINYIAYSASVTGGTYNCQLNQNLFTPTVNMYYVIGSFVNSATLGETENYATLSTAACTFSTNEFIILGSWQGSISGTTAITPTNTKWLRVRIYPPNGIMPSSNSGAVIPTLSGISLTSSNQIVDQGQTETLTYTVSNGVSPYTYNFIISNTAVSPVNVIANQIWSNSLTTNTFSFTVPTTNTNAIATITYSGNVLDSTGGNYLLTNTIQINLALAAASPTESNATIDLGQLSLQTSHPSGGKVSYSYQWYTIAGSTAPTCTGANAISGATASTYLSAPTTTNSYAYQVTDSATTPVSVCSSGDTLTENPALAIPTQPTPTTSQTYDTGQIVTFATTVAGGSPNYVYKWIIANSVTKTILNTTTFSSTSSISNSFAFTMNSNLAGNTIYANVVVTDSATTNSITNSINSGTITINKNMSTPTVSPSSQEGVDSGQTISFTTSFGGSGTSTYTYNWIVYNSITKITLNSTKSSATSSTSNIFVFTANSNLVGNTLNANVFVTDSSQSPITLNSILTAKIYINATLVAGAITPSSPTTDSGQSVTLTAHPSAGTPAYSYAWYTHSGSAGTGSCNAANVISGQISSTISVSPTTTNSYTYQVTDSAVSPETACSSSDTVTVNSALGTPSISPSSAQSYDTGQIITFSTTVGGTANYQYEWIIANSVTKTTLNTTTYSSVGSSSNSFAFTMNSNLAGNTIYANVIVTDSATTNSITNSINSGTITINKNMSTPTISPSSASSVNAGQTISFSTSLTGGTSSYTYKWQVYNSITKSILNTTTYSGVSSTSNVFVFTANSNLVGNTIDANVLVTDNSQSPTSVNSILSGTITINSASGVPTLTPSNTILDSGQIETYTASWSGGTSPYTVNFYNITGSKTQNTLTGVSSSPSTNTFTTGATGTFSYNVIITDSASSTTNSISNSIIVNSALGVPTQPTPTSSQSYDTGQVITFSTTVSGGSPNYIYKWIIANTITHTILNTTTFSATSSTSNSFAFTMNSNLAGNTIYANVIVTDSATTNSITNSINSGTITINKNMSTPTISPSSASSVNAGQTISFSTSLTGGTSSYTYKWQVYNSITKSILNTTTYSGVSSTSNVFVFTANSNLVGNTIDANVLVTDNSQSPTSVNSILSGTITINSASGVPTLTPSNTILDSGQIETYTASWSGGTSPYTVNFYNITGSKTQNTLTGVSSSPSTNTFTTGATGTFSYNVIITDSASSTTNSISNTIVVNPALVAGAITPSSPIINSGQSQTLTSNPSGGTSSYTYKWYTNSAGNPACNNANVITGQTGSTISVSPTTTNSYTYQVTDSATTSVNVCSVSDTVNVNSVLEISSWTASNVVDASNQYETLTAQISGGSSPYTYNILVYNSIALVTNALYSSISLTSNTYTFQINPSWGSGTFTANLIVTDSASNTVTNSLTFTVNNMLTSIYWSASSNVITQNQTQTLTAQVSGGTQPYTYNFLVYNISGVLMSNALYIGISSTSNAYAFQTNQLWGLGTYTANLIVTDSASNTITNSLTFTVNNLVSPLSATVTGPTSADYFSLVTETFNGTATLNNQTLWSLYVDGVLYGTTNSIISWHIQGQTGTYALKFTNPGNANYTPYTLIRTVVIGSPGTGGGPPPAPSSTIVSSSSALPYSPPIILTSTPFYSSLSYGISLSSQINLLNTAPVLETINLSVPTAFSSLVNLSSSYALLYPNQSVGIVLLFKPTPKTPIGTYSIPLNITTKAKGYIKTSQIQFLTFSVFASTNTPSVYDQITLVNSTSATGSIQITNPTNSTFNAIGLDTYLPASIVTNATNIKTPGTLTNISLSKGLYVIHWNLGSLHSKQTIYERYIIEGPRNLDALASIQQILTISSSASAANLIRIINPYIPALYTNSTSVINISAVYTGTSPQQVTFRMTAPPGIILQNATQNLTAIPSQSINSRFGIKTTNSTGTFVMVLYTSTNNTNSTYYLPATVSKRFNQTTTSNSISQQQQSTNYYRYLRYAIEILLVILLIYIIKLIISYNMARSKRADQLVRIKRMLQNKESPNNDKKS